MSNKTDVHEYLNKTSFEDISTKLKQAGLTDSKKLQEFKIIQKIAKSLSADEFCNHNLTIDDVAVKLTPQEMEVARGGRLYPTTIDYDNIIKGLATNNPIEEQIKLIKQGSPFNPN